MPSLTFSTEGEEELNSRKMKPLKKKENNRAASTILHIKKDLQLPSL